MTVVIAALALLALFGGLELVAWVRELLEDRRMYRAAIAGWQSAADRAERYRRRGDRLAAELEKADATIARLASERSVYEQAYDAARATRIVPEGGE